MSLDIPRQFNASVHFVDQHIAAGRGSRLALICEDQRLSYAEVHAQVNQLGNALLRLGVRMEDRVALLLLDGPPFVASFWGAMKIGAVPVPINTLLRAKDYLYILNDCRAEILIASEPFIEVIEQIRPQLTHLKNVIVAGAASSAAISYDQLTAPEPVALAPAPTTHDDAAFWLYTSGTTGTPKAAIHLHHDMVVCCEAFGRHVLDISEADRCYSVAKLFFAYGLGNALYYPFAVGASAVLNPGRFEPAKVFDIIARERPTIFYAVPTAYAALLRHAETHGRPDLGSVRLCSSAGESLPRKLYERWLEMFGVEIIDGIGTTELCHTFISNRPGEVRPGSSGTIVPGYEAKLVDEQDREVPRGEVGALMVKGDSICAGYWNQHERTKAAIVGEWIRTGDKYTRDEDGFFWYAGRSDDMIKASGQWVSPVEVESALIEHPAVLEAGVVGAEDDDGLTKPLAFVVLKDVKQASSTLEGDLKELVKNRLAPFKYPRWVTFLPDLPKTATGKIQRYQLRAMAAQRGAANPGSGQPLGDGQ